MATSLVLLSQTSVLNELQLPEAELGDESADHLMHTYAHASAWLQAQ